MSQICAYLINITMQDTLALFWDILHAKPFVSLSVLKVTLSMQLNMLNIQEHSRIMVETTHSLQVSLSLNNYMRN